MQIVSKKIKYYVKIFLIAALLADIIFIFYFLDYYFYPALSGAETVFTLQKNTATQTVDLKKFNQIADKISQRSSSSEPIVKDNPIK
jgi:hypothetical protein